MAKELEKIIQVPIPHKILNWCYLNWSVSTDINSITMDTGRRHTHNVRK